MTACSVFALTLWNLSESNQGEAQLPQDGNIFQPNGPWQIIGQTVIFLVEPVLFVGVCESTLPLDCGQSNQPMNCARRKESQAR